VFSQRGERGFFEGLNDLGKKKKLSKCAKRGIFKKFFGKQFEIKIKQ